MRARGTHCQPVRSHLFFLPVAFLPLHGACTFFHPGRFTRKTHKSRFPCDRVRFNTLLSLPRPRFQKYHAVPISRYNHSFKQFASMLLKQSTRSAKVSFRLCKSHLYSHGGHQFEYLATSYRDYTIQRIENRAGQKGGPSLLSKSRSGSGREFPQPRDHFSAHLCTVTYTKVFLSASSFSRWSW